MTSTPLSDTAASAPPASAPPSATAPTSAPSSSAPSSSAPPIPRSSWLALVVILVAEMLDGLDALITSIGGPALLADLHGGPALLQWTAAAYTLSMASGLLIGGRLGDMFGKRRLFLIGMVGFTLGSLLSACAPVAGVLILGRVLQGLLGALMLPQGMGMIRSLFPGEHAAKAFGLFGPMMMVAGIGGPILAGVLMDLDPFGLSWRSLFAVNVIPCVLAVIAGIRLLPREDSARSLSLDWTGAALSAAAMAAIVYPLVEGRELGWPAWTLVMLAGGIALLGVFLLQQRRRSRTGRDALIEPSLFRNRTFLAGLAIMLVFFGGTGAIGMLTALFLQMGLGMSPLLTSIVTIAEALGMMLGMAAAAKLGGTRRTMAIGMVIAALGQLLTLLGIAAQGMTVNAWLLTPMMLIAGLGIGIGMGPTFSIIITGVTDAEAGSASGALTSVQQISTALGVSTLGSLFFAIAAGTASPVLGFAHGLEAALAINVVLILLSIGLLRFLPQRAAEDAEEF